MSTKQLQKLSTDELWNKHQELLNTWDGVKYPNKTIERQINIISEILRRSPNVNSN